MKRDRIKDILTSGPLGQSLSVAGWVRSLRQSANVGFIDLTDGSSLAGLQLVVSPESVGFERLAEFQTGAALRATGELVESPAQGQKYELRVASLELLGPADPETYPIQKKKHTLEFLRQKAHLRVRTNTFGAVFRLRSHLCQGIHSYFQRKGFFYIHTPLVTTSDCEGAGELFQVNSTRHKDFFGRQAYLTVSGQLEAEMLALGLGEVYTFGPTFRAENSNTPRHLSEFWMVEPEMAFYELSDNMDLAEDFLKELLRYMLEHDSEDLEFMQKWYEKGLLAQLDTVISRPFVRMSYTQAIEELKKSGRSFEFPVEWGADLQTEHERCLTEQIAGGPVILHDYPARIKPFYMRLSEDGETVGAMDVLFPRIGEIIGGSQREERLSVLEQRMAKLGLSEEAYWWYLDSRRFGSAPHSGFGLGLERALLFLSGMANIRDVIPFPRCPGSADF